MKGFSGAIHPWLTAFLLLTTLQTGVAADEELLANGDFELAGGEEIPGWRPEWRSEGIRQLLDELGEAEAREGRGCVLLDGSERTRQALLQVIQAPRPAAVARLTGWIRVEVQIPGDNPHGNLYLGFHRSSLSYHPQHGHHAGSVTETGSWTRVEIEVPVPEEPAEWVVRCSLTGGGLAWFDDLSLTVAETRGEWSRVALRLVSGRYQAVADGAQEGAHLDLSIPFPFEQQVPLAIRATSIPPDRIDRLEILEERENRPLRIHLRPLEDGERVRVRVETLLFVQDVPLHDGAEVPLAGKRAIPRSIRALLKPAPGVACEDPGIREAAGSFRREDLLWLMADLRQCLRARLSSGSAGGDQGALECLERGGAVCTGNANVAASLLRAADVPARILACTMTTGELQEHYIVEVWTPSLGWSRFEPSAKLFPCRASHNPILRVLYPDTPRRAMHTMTWFRASDGLEGDFDGEPRGRSYQGAERLGDYALKTAEAEDILHAAGRSFERLASRPVPGDALLILEPEQFSRDLCAESRTKLEAVSSLLAEWQ